VIRLHICDFDISDVKRAGDVRESRAPQNLWSDRPERGPHERAGLLFGGQAAARYGVYVCMTALFIEQRAARQTVNMVGVRMREQKCESLYAVRQIFF